MKRLLLILILILSYQSLVNAQGIGEFKVEGMSVGESLLKFMSKKDIKKNDLKYYSNNSKFFTTNYNGKLNTYDVVEIMIKRNDSNYIIHTIRGGIFVKDLNKCLVKRDKMINDIRSLFKNAIFNSGKQEHYLYPNSFQYISQFTFDNSKHQYDNIRSECMIFDKKLIKKKNFANSLSLIVQSGIIVDWIDSQ